MALAYYGFFFVGLYVHTQTRALSPINLSARYVQRRSKRKYLPGSFPTRGNMVHNMWCSRKSWPDVDRSWCDVD